MGTPVVNMKQRSNKRAKINVLRQFYVIGVMEQFEDTLEMFEHTLPRFFTGISSLWSTQGKYYFQPNRHFIFPNTFFKWRKRRVTPPAPIIERRFRRLTAPKWRTMHSSGKWTFICSFVPCSMSGSSGTISNRMRSN